MRKLVFWCGVLAGALVASDLPVRDVVLYKNGVGYFRRAGEMKSGESARLDFRAAEMNDVLKSLTILEEGGGRITGLRYDSSEPLGRKLAEFPFQVGDRQPLSALLDQLKGSRVELQAGSAAVAGVIAGAREVAGDEKRPSRQELIVLLDSGELRTYDLGGITGIRFPDPVLQAQLKDYLASVAHSRSRENRSVYIDSTEAGSRRLQATYVIPTPVWKSSYRLILAESGEAKLEGWAIVDNTSQEDWTGIRLSLVSGRPVSFISRLYEPRYIERQVAELDEERAAAPVVHAGAVEAERPAKPLETRARMMPAPPLAPAAAVAGLAERMDIASSIAATAEARELGELFEYRFAGPVTVRKNESAMLPFVQQKISARKLLIYSGPASGHARNAAEIVNSAEKTLDGGPITVYDGNAYAGEALMETLKAADKRLISYAEDLGTRITTQLGSSQDMIREIHLRRGLLTSRSAIQETKTYIVRNVDRKAKTLILEHPIRPEYRLLNVKPAETTAAAYRFEVKLAPGATEKFPVTEERPIERSVALANITPDFLLTYVQNKSLDEGARKQLERVARLKGDIAQNDAEARRVEQQINDLARDEDRLRQNIASLNRVSGQQEQVQNYARQLAAQEAQIASLRDRLAEVRKKKAALEAELNALIEKLEF